MEVNQIEVVLHWKALFTNKSKLKAQGKRDLSVSCRPASMAKENRIAKSVAARRSVATEKLKAGARIAEAHRFAAMEC